MALVLERRAWQLSDVYFLWLTKPYGARTFGSSPRPCTKVRFFSPVTNLDTVSILGSVQGLQNSVLRAARTKECVSVVGCCSVGSDKASQPVLEWKTLIKSFCTVPSWPLEYFLRVEDRKVFDFFVFKTVVDVIWIHKYLRLTLLIFVLFG